MNKALLAMWEKPFIRFLIAGGTAALVNVLSRMALSELISFRASVVVAYLIGMVCAWLLSRLFVFTPTNRHWSSELIRFGIVNVIAILQVWSISVGLAEWLFPLLGYGFYPEATAHAIGVMIPVFTSYAGHRYFSFARRGIKQPT